MLSYNRRMDTDIEIPGTLAAPARDHLANFAANLQLVADMAYGDVALAVAGADGSLRVIADARPITAVAALAVSRLGQTLAASEEPEAYEALGSGRTVRGERRRTTRGISYVTSAYPIGGEMPYAVFVENLASQVAEAPGTMETEFMRLADDLLGVLSISPLRDVETAAPFATTRTAGDGVMRIGPDGALVYASPNAVTIMKLAGVESVRGAHAAELPGGGLAIARVAEPGTAAAAEVEFAGRSLLYRTIALERGAFVLVEDVTEARRREQELKVKETTIREVHHRVKNNLQTIAALLRLQARRAQSDNERRSLSEAVERVTSMAVVHEMLAGASDERVDFAEVCRTVVEQVRRGMAGESPGVTVMTEGDTGYVSAAVATSLSLVAAELVHNAIEHGVAGRPAGVVTVSMRREPDEVVLQVHDDGPGMPADVDPESGGHLGLAIVRTLVQDDLRGTLSFSRSRGTAVTVRVPLGNGEEGR
ncbi:MAG: hypothetical protein C0418_00525 [Coriobacteriaceae bacterium]|nr:hypothetical protein [Coriobacteriaceae bacterium]